MRLNSTQRRHQAAISWLLDDNERRTGRSVLMVVEAMRLSIFNQRPILVNDHGTAAGSWHLRDITHFVSQEYGIKTSLTNFRVFVDTSHNRPGLTQFLEDTQPAGFGVVGGHEVDSPTSHKSLIEVLKEEI